MTLYNLKKEISVFVRYLLVACLIFYSALSFGFQQKTVKVGYFSLGQFQSYDEHGYHKGYNVDFLNEIAKYTHWKYEFIDCNNWGRSHQKT